MKFIKQHTTLPVINVDVKTTEVNNKRHGKLLPNSIRGLIVGPSNCGKTNAMLTLLKHPNGLHFENIYIYSKSLHQPKYEYLKRLTASIKGMGYHTFSNNSEVVPPEESKPNSIFIFDDVACGKQDNIRNYFCMGRHNSVDSFYLCQTYARIPKHLIRDNANFIIIFKQDERNLRHIYNDHVNSDMSFQEFHKICTKCWVDQFGFLTIDKDSPLNNGRYRKQFDEFISL